MMLRWGFVAFVALSTALMAKEACSVFTERDVFWHLRMGADLIQYGLSPFRDHYSFTFENHRINWPPVAFQVLIFYLTSWFGTIGGILIYKSVCLGLVIVLTQRLLDRRQIARAIQVFALAFLVVALPWRNEARPELLSFVLVPVLLRWILDARATLTDALVAKMTLLLLVWSNYHVSAIFGYLLLGSLYVELFLKNLKASPARSPAMKRILAGSVLLLLVSFLNPGRNSVLIDVLAVAATPWHAYIREYIALDAADYGLLGRVYLAFCAYAWLHAVWRRAWMPLIVLTVLIQQGLAAARFFPVLVLLTVPFVAIASQDLWSHLLKERMKRWLKTSTAVLMIGLLLAAYVQHASTVLARPWVTAIPLDDLPQDLTAYVSRSNFSGKVFNEFGTGGYLINELAPQVRVYIDGRTQILYPFSFMEHYIAVRSDPALLREEAERRDIDYVIASHGAAPLLDTALRSGVFGVVYSGQSHTFLSKRLRPFPGSEILLTRPECAAQLDLATLLKELHATRRDMHDRSLLRLALELVTGYLAADDRKAFLSNPHKALFSDRRLARLAGHLSRQERLYELALRYFLTYENDLLASDILNRAAMLVKLGKHADADKVLGALTNYGGLSLQDLYALHLLLTEAGAEGVLKSFDASSRSAIALYAARYTEWLNASPPGDRLCRLAAPQ